MFSFHVMELWKVYNFCGNRESTLNIFAGISVLTVVIFIFLFYGSRHGER